MKHTLLHILGCTLPILVIILLPGFGVSSGITFTLFVILMFGCHLIMMGGHGHAHEDHHPINDQHPPNKTAQ
ncbi:MAG: hypothetical protein O3A92_10785 [Verrucomicrobia bacterium]|nr:hypothetical protein [Verrucomicrobiota bacterium]